MLVKVEYSVLHFLVVSARPLNLPFEAKTFLTLDELSFSFKQFSTINDINFCPAFYFTALFSKVFQVPLQCQELGSDGIPHLVAKSLQFVETHGTFSLGNLFHGPMQRNKVERVSEKFCSLCSGGYVRDCYFS